MTAASLDRLLALLSIAAVATGGLTLRAGAPGGAWVFGAHALVAGALVAAIVLKLRSSVPRSVARGRWAHLALGLGVALVASAALAGGYAWVVSARLPSIGAWTVMTLHAWAGIILLPIVVLHLIPRRWRLLKPGPDAVGVAGRRLLSRRALLTGAAFGAVAVGLTQAAALADRLGGGVRRFTGSRLLQPGGIPPATTFLLDELPAFDAAAWRLRIHGRVQRPADLTLDELRALGEFDVEATLDCTSGWALETTWRGIPLPLLLASVGADPAARGVVVRSMTGWLTNLPLDEAQHCVLATGVAGQDLPPANGSPCRLVVPSRRGVDWVKWVDEIEVA
ncbi:MAG TPA: molybdopterin-dependent oxidoreductase [Candidatus Eisenbacteria bacterium]|nr:molybdopterin-dependent oxidoreductase [Candidatus Eisenbacteria bacterium]